MYSFSDQCKSQTSTIGLIAGTAFTSSTLGQLSGALHVTGHAFESLLAATFSVVPVVYLGYKYLHQTQPGPVDQTQPAPADRTERVDQVGQEVLSATRPVGGRGGSPTNGRKHHHQPSPSTQHRASRDGVEANARTLLGDTTYTALVHKPPFRERLRVGFDAAMKSSDPKKLVVSWIVSLAVVTLAVFA